MLGLGLSLQKGISAFNAGRALVSSYIRRVTEAGGVLQNTACDAAAINELNQDRLLEPASWVLVPDGIKEDVVYAQKPTSGLGDLTFTRASDATRTNSAGVIERTPWNLLQQSNTFTTTWTTTFATLTSGQTGYDGTNNAWLLSKSSASGRVDQNITLTSGSYTFSAYAKAGTKNWIFLRVDGTSNRTAYFNLQDGTLGTTIGCTSSISSVGGGWYRCSITFTDSVSTVRIFVADANGSTSGTSGNILIQAAQVVEGTSALDYFPTTNRQDVPRIDFRNADGTLSSCGRLLLEPQRTNSMLYSQAINSWAFKTELTITDNNTISPDGTQNASYIQQTTGGNAVTFQSQNVNVTTGQIQTISFFAKAKEVTAVTLRLATVTAWTGNRPTFTCDLTNGTITLIAGTATVSSQNIGNGWYRFVIVTSAVLITTTTTLQTITGAVISPNSGDGFYLWGVQWEQNATYPTTYIPTTTAAVTRIADTASKTGVSSIIGQSAGTIFWDVNDVTGAPANTGNPDFGIRNTAFTNWIGITTNGFNLTFRVDVRATSGILISYTANITRAKAAVAWSSAGAVLYVNGVQVGTSAVNPNFSFDVIQMLGGVISYKTNQAALFTTRLSNDQLEVLTSEGYGTYALLAQSLNCVLQ
jgi:hypothetical protein